MKVNEVSDNVQQCKQLCG